MPAEPRNLIHFFARRVPGVGRTLIVKFLYLADLEARRILGRPLSPFNYIWWDHGPFDSAILANLDTLCRDGFLDVEMKGYGGSGKSGYEFRITEKEVEYGFSKEEAAILDLVARTYGKIPLQTLLEDVVYKTLPMMDAQERDAYGGLLSMDLVNNQFRLPPDVTLGDVLQAIDDINGGLGKPFRDILERKCR